ncbi:efflux RND transporter periplasmic adaptor subunit [Cohnella nanjingensis]|uniref:Efflux RND transporter periplasmic adaptor subunit n=1 Tax=Cohnella nanjingensis TaxID=1387779 RepID=A0A7X0VFL3_9BACL|nr:efflux RND transporter periplasmic adaptor subunit [Cohnella nanjingensis]MBB6671408.1 efflux RND transporter periplasmic adaptor subunit [Cohnella nanjingensis]
MRSKRAAALALSLALGAALAGCSLLPKEEEALAPPLVKPAKENYQTVKVEKGTITNAITQVASFESVQSDVAQFTGTGGRVEKILVSAGDKVKKGDPLVQLVMNDLDLQVKEQELALERAKYALRQQQGSHGDEEALKIAGLQVQVEQIKYDRLFKQYNNKILTAGMDGQVVFVEDLKPGDYVDTYQTIVTVADPRKLQLSARIDSADSVKNVDVGFPVEVNVQVDGKQTTLKGKVVQTPSSAPQTLNKDLAERYSKTLYITVDHLPDAVEIGAMADIKIITQQKENVLKIPRSGLRSFMGRNFVRVLEDGNKLREIDVQPGIAASTEVEIVQGLAEGDNIVLQ